MRRPRTVYRTSRERRRYGRVYARSPWRSEAWWLRLQGAAAVTAFMVLMAMGEAC